MNKKKVCENIRKWKKNCVLVYENTRARGVSKFVADLFRFSLVR